MPVTGDLETMPLTDLLQWASATRRTGVLEVEAAGHKRRIELRDGSITACWTNDPRARLGQFLLGRGRITEEQLSDALKVHDGGGVTLGRALLDLNILSEADLTQVIAQKAEETITDLFDWDDALFRFDKEKLLNGGDQIDVRMGVESLLLQVAQREDEIGEIRELFESSRVVLERTDKEPPKEVTDHAVLVKLYESVDGTRCIGELLLHARASEFLVLKLMRELHKMGLVKIKSRDGAGTPGIRTLLDPPEPRQPKQATEPEEGSGEAESDAGRELLADIEVARRLISRDESSAALELLQASLRAHPGNDALRTLIAEAEEACMKGLRGSVSSDAVPVVVDADAAEGEVSPEESFLLSLIDGKTDVRSLTWVSPLREVDLLRSLQRMADRGWIELQMPAA